MGHYDHLQELATACPLVTMQSMAKLGMKAGTTECHRWGVFEGYGVRLEIPSNMELDIVGAMKLIVEQARAEGAKENQKMVRKVLGIS